MWNLKGRVFDPIPGNNSSCLTASPRIRDRWGSFYHRKSHRHGGRGLGSIPLQWVIHCYRFRGHPWGSGRNTDDRSPGQGSLFACFKRRRLPSNRGTSAADVNSGQCFPKPGACPATRKRAPRTEVCPERHRAAALHA